MRLHRSLLVATAATLTLAVAAPAQFSQLPGSGCPGGSSITTVGTPQLGMLISYQWFCSARADTPFLLFAPATPPIFPLPLPIACASGCLLIHPSPPLLVPGPAGQGLKVQITIPQDPSLIGQTIHTQGGCLSATSTCIYLGVGTATRIM